jgi:hypothetical protein
VTGPVPDLLDAIKARYPGIVTVSQAGDGRWVLVIADGVTDTRWQVGSGSRSQITGAAIAWERFRDGYLHGPRRCTCGRGYTEHEWGPKKGACPTGTGRYQPAEGTQR